MMGPLHASEYRTYMRCPREHQLAYVSWRVPRERSEALTIGTEAHRFLEGWWRGDESPPEPSSPVARACCLGYAARWGRPTSYEWIRCELPWEETIGGVRCAGTFDVRCAERGGAGEQVIVEHKTTSSDIAPGASYWREVTTSNVQVSMYLAAFPKAKVLYDVIRKPALKRLEANTRRAVPESDDEYVARMLAAMAEDPDRYFQRFTVVRLESEADAFFGDLRLVDERRRLPMQPRNPDACFSFGRRCGYYDVCWHGSSLADDAVFQDQEVGR